MLINGEEKSFIRLSDFSGIIPAINGKIELVYEGEEQGADQISFNLINEGVKSIFLKYFPEVSKLEKPNEETPYDSLLNWFIQNDNEIFIGDDFTDSEYKNVIDQIKELSNLVKKYCKDIDDKDQYFVKEILLWGLTSFKKLTKNRMEDGIEFKDSLGSYLKNFNS